jgi:ZIP family zinc transporter
MTQQEIFLLGSLASLIAGLGTGLGALPIFAIQRLSTSLETTLLALSGGIMLAASAFSLLIPSLEVASGSNTHQSLAGLLVATGTLLGGTTFWLVHRYIPHEHFTKGRESCPETHKDSLFFKRLWLLIIAITLHNFPEGLAVGVGFGGSDSQSGWALTTGIAIQNMPEGFIVALALVSLGYSRGLAFLVALFTGLVEPVGGLVGAGAVAYVEPLLPWALAFAAGAMLFVVGGEMIPETHRKGYETQATFGLLVGFCLMIVLDTALG